MTLMLTIGQWGGVYVHWGYTIRVCFGWVALTFIRYDMDDVLFALWESE